MDQPNASGIGVQTMQKDGTKNNPQPGQYEKQYEPAATTETTVTKTETPKKKGKKGCIIFIVLIVCCLITLIGGGIAAYLNAGTILKSIANSTKDTTYTTYTTSTISAFKLSDFMSKQTAAVDANGDMTFDFDLDTIAKYALSAVPSAIQTDIGVKLAPGQILINMPMSDLQPTIISKDNFKDIYVKII